MGPRNLNERKKVTTQVFSALRVCSEFFEGKTQQASTCAPGLGLLSPPALWNWKSSSDGHHVPRPVPAATHLPEGLWQTSPSSHPATSRGAHVAPQPTDTEFWPAMTNEDWCWLSWWKLSPMDGLTRQVCPSFNKQALGSRAAAQGHTVGAGRNWARIQDPSHLENHAGAFPR